MACLRLAHRVLGMKRDRLGLGLLGSALSARGLSVSIGLAAIGAVVAPNVAMAQFVTSNGATPTATGTNASAAGAGATTTGNYGLAIGAGASAANAGVFGPNGETNQGDIAIGSGAIAGPAAGGSTLALGTNAHATAPGGAGDSLAIGTSSVSSGIDSTAIGGETTASAQNAIAIGNNGTTAAGFNSTVLGVNSGATAAAIQSIVIGNNSNAVAANQTVIGVGASGTAAGIGGVALGQGAVANRAALAGGAELYSRTIVASTQGAVSVGAVGAERQIINVAGGTQATDAVNVRQLGAVGTNLATALGGGAGFNATTGAFTAPTYTVGTTNYNNVGSAITALAAGTGSGSTFVSDNTAGAAAPVATGQNSSAGGYGASATGPGSTVVGNGATDNGHAGAVAVGNNAAVLGDGSIAIGQGTTANTAISTQNVADFRTPGNPLKQINNLPAGTTGFVPTGTAIGALSTVGNGGGVAIGYNNNAGNTVQSQVSTAIGADNLSSGVNSITLGLNNTASNRGSIAIGTDSQSTGLRAIAMGREAYAYGDFSVAQGYLASAYGANSLSYGPNSVAGVNGGAAAGDVAIGSGATSTLGNSVALGAGSVASRGAEAGYTGYAVGTQTSTGEVAVGTAAAPRTITGVSAGRLGTDAVDVSQLGAVGTSLAGSLGGGAGFDGTTGAYTAPTYTVAGTNYNNVGAAIGALSTASGVFVSDNTAGAAAPVATGANSSAGGYGASATGPGSTVVGNGATDNGQGGAVAVGNDASAGTSKSVAIGQGATTTAGGGVAAVAIGNAAVAQGDGAVSLGLISNANGTGATAGGNHSSATGDSAVAFGDLATAAGTSSTSFGVGSKATGESAFAAGTGATATGASAFAMGTGSSASQDGAIAFGGGAASSAGNAVSIGSGANSSVANGVALGAGSTATRAGLAGAAENFSGTAVGSTQGAVSVGDVGAERQITNVAGGTQATDAVNVRQLSAVGSNLAGSLGGGAAFDPTTGAYTAPTFTTAAGTTAGTVQAALGNETAAITSLGNGTATKLGGGVTYNPTTGLLANGFTVNGTTYGDVASAISGAAANDGIVQRTATAGQVAVTAPGGTGTAPGAAQVVTNVAPGQVAAASTQAINGSQLYGTAGSVATALGGGAGVNANGTVSAPSYTVAGTPYNNVGSAIGAIDTGLANGQLGAFRSDNTAAAAAPVATGANSVAGGFGSSATAPASTVVGNGATDNGVANSTALGNGAAVTAGLTGSNVALGQGTIAGRGAETGYTGYGVGTQTSAGEVAVGSAAAPRTITGVSAGRIGTDAVNVSQLSAVGGNLAGSLGGGAAFDATTGAYTAPTFTTAAGTTANTVQAALGNETAAITSLGNGTATKLGGGVTYNPTTGLLANGFTVNGTTYGDVASAISGAAANDGIVQRTATAGQVAVTAPGGTGTAPGAAQVVTNVAAGQVAAGSTQAVNGSQLYGTAASVASGLGGGAGVNADGTVSAPSYTVGGANYNNVGGAIGALDNGLANGQLGAFRSDNTAAAAAPVATGANSVAGGFGSSATAAASTVVGNGATDNSVANSTALGNGAAVTAGLTGSNVALGQGTIAGRGAETGYTGYGVGTQTSAGEVAVGSAAAPRTITGVSAGRLGTDAVNVSQLNAVGGNLAGSLGGGAAFDATTGAYTAPAYTVGGQTYNNVGAALTAGNNLAVQYTPDATGAPTSAVDLTKGGTLAPVAVTGLANATTPTGAVTLAQMPLQYSTAAAPTTANPAVPSGDVTLVGATAGTAVGLHNVAAGTLSGTSTDAVNGSQLFGVSNNVNALGTTTAAAIGGGAGYTPGTGITGPNYTLNGAAAPFTNVVAGEQALANGAAGPVQYAVPGTPGNAVNLVGTGGPVTLGNVAPGTLAAGSTEAVNGGQLFTTNQNVTALTNGTAGLVQQSGPGAPITVGAGTDGTAVGFANNAGAARTLTGVAAGTVAAGSTQAVNGGQLAGTAASVATALGGGSTVNPDGTVSAPTYNVANGTYNNVGSALSALDNGINNGQLGAFRSDNTAGAAAPVATGPNSVAGGFGASATGAGSTVIGNGATDNGVANATVLGNGAAVTAGLAGSNVALGQGSIAGRGAETGYIGYGVGTTTSAGEVAIGSPAAPRTITGVAAGRLGTDAANVAQLQAVGSNLAGSLGGGAAFDPTTGAYTAPGYTVGGQTYNNVGAALAASGNLAVQYTPDATGAATNAIDLTKGGALAPVTMTGLAAGALTATSTDAVNGSQLFATNQQLAAIAGGTAGLVQQDPTTRAITVGAGTDGTTVGFANNAGVARTLTGVAPGTVAAGSTEAVNGGQLYGTAGSVAAALGGGAAVNPDGTVSAPTYGVNGKSYASVGGAITALDSTGVKYDVDPTTGARGQSITLAGGDPNQPVVIHNVGTGTVRTDAANLGQVQDAEAAANQYTNQKVASIDNQLSGVNNSLANLESSVAETREEARSAAAIGLAAASLRYDDRPGKFSVAAGGGYWRGEAAGAFGIGYTLPDGHFRLNATAATAGNNVGVGAGASYTFN